MGRFVSGGSSGAAASLTDFLKLGAEVTLGAPVVDTAQSTNGNVIRLAELFTLPSTAKWWVVSAVECKNANVVGGNLILGAAMYDADPPVNTSMFVVAKSLSTPQVGALAVQKVNMDGSMIIPAGSKISAWQNHDGGGGSLGFRYLPVGAVNNGKATTFGTEWFSSTAAWGASVVKPYLQLYVRPVELMP